MSKIIISALAIVLIFSIAIAAKDTPQVGVKDTPQPNIPRLINYQGELTDTSDNLQNGNFAMVFSIFTAITGGTLYWTETQPSVTVTNGLFNVLLGSVNPIESLPLGPYTYLAITVAGEVIVPRQRIVSNGYSYYADEAAYAYSSGGGVSDNAWVRETPPDSVLFTINQLGIARGDAGNSLYGFYRFTHTNLGNACATGTSLQNYGYATVGGGDSNAASYDYATVGGGVYDTASGSYATVGGGFCNTAGGGWYATVGGGACNSASGWSATVAGGQNDTAKAPYAGALSGYSNLAGDDTTDIAAVVAGGYNNSAIGKYSFVGGGYINAASYDYATIGGGQNDTAKAPYAGALSGYSNLAGDVTDDTAAVVAGGYNNSAIGKYSFVGGGYSNTASGTNATIGGGNLNTASGPYATVGGGDSNITSGGWPTVGGGWSNYATSYATVGGGANNTASGLTSTVGGGANNTAIGMLATVAGGSQNTSAADYSFTTNYGSNAPYDNSAAFNGQTATASGQTRVGALSKASGTFTIDHPLDPNGKILNHYFVESPEMVLIYRGAAVISSDGRAIVHLPDYFDALNKNPMVQLTGVGTSDVFVAEEVTGNRFAIGGKAGTKVYWMVTGDRKDPSAEITRIIMPVEQPKEGDLRGHSLDDDFLCSTKDQLERMGKADKFQFRTQAGRQKYEDSKRIPSEKRK